MQIIATWDLAISCLKVTLLRLINVRITGLKTLSRYRTSVRLPSVNIRGIVWLCHSPLHTIIPLPPYQSRSITHASTKRPPGRRYTLRRLSRRNKRNRDLSENVSTLSCQRIETRCSTVSTVINWSLPGHVLASKSFPVHLCLFITKPTYGRPARIPNSLRRFLTVLAHIRLLRNPLTLTAVSSVT